MQFQGMRVDRQTDRQTDIPVTILRIAPGGKEKRGLMFPMDGMHGEEDILVPTRRVAIISTSLLSE